MAMRRREEGGGIPSVDKATEVSIKNPNEKGSANDEVFCPPGVSPKVEKLLASVPHDFYNSETDMVNKDFSGTVDYSELPPAQEIRAKVLELEKDLFYVSDPVIKKEIRSRIAWLNHLLAPKSVK